MKNKKETFGSRFLFVWKLMAEEPVEDFVIISIPLHFGMRSIIHGNPVYGTTSCADLIAHIGHASVKVCHFVASGANNKAHWDFAEVICSISIWTATHRNGGSEICRVVIYHTEGTVSAHTKSEDINATFIGFICVGDVIDNGLDG